MKAAPQERRRHVFEKQKEKENVVEKLKIKKSKPLTKRAASEVLGNVAKKLRLAHKTARNYQCCKSGVGVSERCVHWV